MTNRHNITFASGGLNLEGELELPQESGRFPAVVICHPHPRYGGDMNNNVVIALANGLRDAGIAALRFNFRGVGGSEGEFDKGVGETQDALEALNFLTLHENIESSRLGIAGYSFGAARALEVCAQSNTPQAAVSIACPMNTFTQVGVLEMLQPKLLVCGDNDHDFPVDQFKFVSKRFEEPKQVEVMYGADHFFRGCEQEIREMAAKFFSEWLG